MTRRFVNGRPPKIHLYSANERRTLCEYYNTLTVETTSDREKATCQRCLDRGGGDATGLIRTHDFESETKADGPVSAERENEWNFEAR